MCEQYFGLGADSSAYLVEVPVGHVPAGIFMRQLAKLKFPYCEEAVIHNFFVLHISWIFI